MKKNISIEQETSKNIYALKRILGGRIKCPICQNEKFSVLYGYIRNDIVTNLEEQAVVGTSTLPTIVLTCQKCGFISQHAVKILRDDKNNDGGE